MARVGNPRVALELTIGFLLCACTSEIVLANCAIDGRDCDLTTIYRDSRTRVGRWAMPASFVLI